MVEISVTSGTREVTVSQLSMHVTNTTPEAGEMITVNGTYQKGDAAPSGKTIKLLVDGTKRTSKATGMGGSYEFKIDFGSHGSYDIHTEASLDGETLSSKTVTVTVYELTIGVSRKSVEVYEELKAYGTYYEGEQAVANQDINLFKNGSKWASGATGSAGGYSFKITFESPGTYTLQAKAPL